MPEPSPVSTPVVAVPDLWPGCGWAALQRRADGGLVPGSDFLRVLLQRPELAPVPESCASERALHAALLQDPWREVTPERLARLQDADARDNHAFYLRFRAALQAAGTLQRYLLGLFRPGPVDIPPSLVDWLTQLLVRDGLQAVLTGAATEGVTQGEITDESAEQRVDETDLAVECRAAELLFRPQRITLHEGRVLAGDRDTLDRRQATGGLGELGRLLREAQLPLRGVDAAVLGPDTVDRYWASATVAPAPATASAAAGQGVDAASAFFSPTLLDLTHETTREVGHGLAFTTRRAHSGAAALARVLQRWVAQLLGVKVRITPVPRIDDERWRWHIGLDAEASAMLNDLYTGQALDAERQRRLLALFRLDFDDPAEMHPDIAGRPVWLGLAMTADGLLRLKPQNLLVNLPLRALQ